MRLAPAILALALLASTAHALPREAYFYMRASGISGALKVSTPIRASAVSHTDSRNITNTLLTNGLYGPFHADSISNLPRCGTSYDSYWISGAGATNTKWAMYDIGEAAEISGLIVYNYNEPTTARGISNTIIYVSSDNAAWVSRTNVSWTPVSTLTIARASGNTNYIGSVYPLPKTSARYVKFDNMTSWGDSTYIGLSKVRIISGDFQ